MHRGVLGLEEQRVQALFADFGYNRDPGRWMVLAMVVDPSDVPAVEGELWDAIARLQRTPVDPARLDDAR